MKRSHRQRGRLEFPRPCWVVGVDTIEPVVDGDASVACISAASIIAKVARDAHMLELESYAPVQSALCAASVSANPA